MIPKKNHKTHLCITRSNLIDSTKHITTLDLQNSFLLWEKYTTILQKQQYLVLPGLQEEDCDCGIFSDIVELIKLNYFVFYKDECCVFLMYQI